MTDKPPEGEDPGRMSLGEHLDELRRRILYALAGIVVGMGAMLYFTPDLIEFLRTPYAKVMTDHGLQPELTVLDVTAGFTIYIKVALYAGLLAASPWVFYQLWMFVSAGLHAREKRYVLFAVPFSAVLFVCGVAFFLLVVAMPILHFFIGVSTWLGVTPMITFENHIGFMTRFMVIFGLGFQTPLVILLLGLMGLVTTKTLNKYRRHVIVAMFILGALMTSPSPIDQIALALPMWMLYELGVLLVYVFQRRRAKDAEAPP